MIPRQRAPRAIRDAARYLLVGVSGVVVVGGVVGASIGRSLVDALIGAGIAFGWTVAAFAVALVLGPYLDRRQPAALDEEESSRP